VRFRVQQGQQPLGQLDLRLVQEQVAGVRDPADLSRHRVDDGRVGVAEGGDGDAGDQVEVAVAVGVPDPAALAAGQGERRGAVVDHHRGLEPAAQGVALAHRAPPCAASEVVGVMGLVKWGRG
jgi:hypothetical protein